MAHKSKPAARPVQLPTPREVVTKLYADLASSGGLQWLSFQDPKGSPAMILVARGQFACDLMDTMMATVRETMEQVVKTTQAQVQVQSPAWPK